MASASSSRGDTPRPSREKRSTRWLPRFHARAVGRSVVMSTMFGSVRGRHFPIATGSHMTFLSWGTHRSVSRPSRSAAVAPLAKEWMGLEPFTAAVVLQILIPACAQLKSSPKSKETALLLHHTRSKRQSESDFESKRCDDYRLNLFLRANCNFFKQCPMNNHPQLG